MFLDLSPHCNREQLVKEARLNLAVLMLFQHKPGFSFIPHVRTAVFLGAGLVTFVTGAKDGAAAARTIFLLIVFIAPH